MKKEDLSAIFETHPNSDRIINFSGSQSAVKLKLGVNGINFNKCANNYRTLRLNLTGNSQLCASGKGGDGTCNGDSGDSIDSGIGCRSAYIRDACIRRQLFALSC